MFPGSHESISEALVAGGGCSVSNKRAAEDAVDGSDVQVKGLKRPTIAQLPPVATDASSSTCSSDILERLQRLSEVQRLVNTGSKPQANNRGGEVQVLSRLPANSNNVGQDYPTTTNIDMHDYNNYGGPPTNSSILAQICTAHSAESSSNSVNKPDAAGVINKSNPRGGGQEVIGLAGNPGQISIDPIIPTKVVLADNVNQQRNRRWEKLVSFALEQSSSSSAAAGW